MSPSPRHLLLPPVYAALDAWLADPDAGRADLHAAIADLADAVGVRLGELRVNAPPLADLELSFADVEGLETILRQPGGSQPIGWLRAAGDADAIGELTVGLELLFGDASARLRASRAERQLAALDQAVRGISGVLDVDRVLQLIADRVRELVGAQYAAIGIVDREGTIERFITSGISAEGRARIGDLPRGHGLLGLIIRENRTYRVPDIATHPQRYGFPPHHPQMHSFLGMPIRARDEVVGRLYLTNKVGAAEFSEEDARLVEMFALHAGIAIENARLYDRVGRLAIVDERDRISRDLHDSVIQAIYAQTLALDDVPDLVAEDPAEASRRVDEAIDALHAVIRDIRNFIFGLRPVLLEAGTFATGLRQLATELHRNGGVTVQVDVDEAGGTLEVLPIETTVELLAITREALSNIARHASATKARVAVGVEQGLLRLEIEDDGRGFAGAEGTEHGHHGLGNMRARSRALGAGLEVRSTPGRGTRIIVTLPAGSRTEKEDR
ncbi:MAG TPA: GAF domain-containing sensor histidine kinase [Candidatus Limnocylindria bacterium]|nr:GAF domain-containing sensor histidine kinase [Candidatus Limnocylindria bacterium]